MPRHYRPIPENALRIPVPDTTQQTDYSCGASSLQAIAKYFGVGPDDEQEFVRDIGLDHRVGSHPDQIETTAKRYGLRCRPYPGMSLSELHAELRSGHPVMLMIQAWGRQRIGTRMRPRRRYKKWWKDGHWVVAIGFDEEAIFFEDPSLQAVRGYLRNEELETRWHDTARHGRHTEHFGLAIWHPKRQISAYETRAERIP
jgi:predicted double-glycine peptidase